MRVCECCGKEIATGFTDDCGSTYVCEDCFEEYMDDTYGKHKWMEVGNGETDEFGGYYVCSADVASGIQGTGLYYTEWEDEEDEDDRGEITGCLCGVCKRCRMCEC